MQCKDIPDRPIMEFLLNDRLTHNDGWANWYSMDERCVHNAMPKDIPEKLIIGKMRQLVRRGLVDGCTCGCRGDFEITEKGKDWLLNTPNLVAEKNETTQ